MSTTTELYHLPHDHYDGDELFCPVCLDLLACPVTMGGGVRKDSDEPAVREKTS